MNKNDLVNQVSDSTGLSKSDSAKAVDSVFESITSTLKSGGDVRLVGFGTFFSFQEKSHNWKKSSNWCSHKHSSC